MKGNQNYGNNLSGASGKKAKKNRTKNLMNLPVLVVDDDKTCCESTVATLKEIGIMGEWVLSGREAVERCYARHELKDDYFAVNFRLEDAGDGWYRNCQTDPETDRKRDHHHCIDIL